MEKKKIAECGQWQSACCTMRKLHRTYLRCGIATDKMEKTDGGCPFEW